MVLRPSAMKAKVILTVLLSVLLATVGCSREKKIGDDDPVPSPPDPLTMYDVRLNLGYGRAGEMRDVRIYVFDAVTGKLRDMLHVPTGVIGNIWDLELPEGRYTFVAWGSRNDNLYDGFEPVHMIDLETHTFKTPLAGETTLSDFRLMVDMEQGRAVQFDNIYHALAENVWVAPDRSLKADFKFIRISNTLNVTVEGLDRVASRGGAGAKTTVDANDVQMCVTGRAGTYTYRGAVDPHSPELRYDATNRMVPARGVLKSQVRVLKMEKEYHTAYPMLLHLHNSEGDDVVDPLDVVAYLLESTADKGQDFFDNMSEFDVKLVFQDNNALDLTLIITVDGFEIGEYSIEGIKPWVPPGKKQ